MAVGVIGVMGGLAAQGDSDRKGYFERSGP
jgi:hypothetical protein